MHTVRIAYAAASVIWMLIIFWLSSIPELRSSLPSLWDGVLRKIAHATEYAVLGILLSRSFTSLQRYVLAAVISFLYALSDEWHQGYVVGRHASFADVGIDTLGMAIGLYISKKSDPKGHPKPTSGG